MSEGNEIARDLAKQAELHTIRADIYQLQGNTVLEKQELETAYQMKPELKPNVWREGE